MPKKLTSSPALAYYPVMGRASFLIVLVINTVCLAQMGPAQVRVAPVERRVVETSQPYVASLEPVTTTTLAAEEGGLAAERLFDEGQKIDKGAVLVRTRVDLLQVQREIAQASQQSAAAMLEQSKAEAQNARNELERLQRLYDSSVATEKEYRDALTEDKVAQAVVAGRAGELAEQVAQIKRLDLLIEKSELRSPLAGVISRRYVEVGQWIKQGDPVADLVQLDPLFARVNVPEDIIAKVKPGDAATVTIDALGGQSFSGAVAQILPEADPNSRTFVVKIQLPNPQMTLRPGFFARAMFITRSDEPLYLVPRDAVVSRDVQSHVVAARGGKAVIVPVRRAAGEGDKIAVMGELKEDDQVVIRGNEALRGGEDLMIQDAPAAMQPPAE